MSLLKKYGRHLSALSRQQEVLQTASSIDGARDNLIQLHTIVNELLVMKHHVITTLNKMQISLQRKKETPLASSLFQRSKRKEQEDEMAKLMRGIERYKLMLTDINTVRYAVKQTAIPKLEAVISKSQPDSSPLNYRDYIRSDAWKKKAEEAKAQAGNRCQACNRSRAEVQLEAHHRTYEHLGNEQPGDITVLCRDCHQLIEDDKKTRTSMKKCKKCGKSFTPQKSSYYHCPSCYRSEREIKYTIAHQGKTQHIKEEQGRYSATPQSGVCIRCRKKIKLDLHAPYCYPCFKSWKRYENRKYQEKFCHSCGKEHKSSMAKPICLSCYRKHHIKL